MEVYYTLPVGCILWNKMQGRMHNLKDRKNIVRKVGDM